MENFIKYFPVPLNIRYSGDAWYGTGGGPWSMWTQEQGTWALREILAEAGFPPQEYPVHSLRIGEASLCRQRERPRSC